MATGALRRFKDADLEKSDFGFTIGTKSSVDGGGRRGRLFGSPGSGVCSRHPQAFLAFVSLSLVLGLAIGLPVWLLTAGSNIAGKYSASVVAVVVVTMMSVYGACRQRRSLMALGCSLTRSCPGPCKNYLLLSFV